MPIVELAGCQTTPLGSYLKGLAVLRLLSQQKDPEARASWRRNRFILESSLDEDALVQFFLAEYQPTPIVAPWNAGSGFYPKDRKTGIDGIAGTTSARFAAYRTTIERARSIPEVDAGKAGSQALEDTRRGAIQRACRNRLPDDAVDWLDAAVAITAGEHRRFPPILGTGGNEGRLDYTNNFMEHLTKLLIKPDRKLPVEPLLHNAMFGHPVTGFEKAAAGQYDPGRAGGFNQGEGVENKDIPTNPWNLVLTLEGAVSWASGLHRRQGVTYSQAFLSSPFTVYPSAVGYSSASSADKPLARAEIWVPVWAQPASYHELELLMREGRAQLKRGPAKDGIQFARAVASLGVDRGIEGFVRFSLLKRRGDSYVALPASNFSVPKQKLSETDLLEEAAPLIGCTDEFLRHFRDNPPTSLTAARRRYDDTVFEFLLRGDKHRFLAVVASLGRIQRETLLRPHDSRTLLPRSLTAGWLSAAAGRPEAGIAAALARIPGILSNLTREDKSFAWSGGTLAARMASVLARRLMEDRGTASDRYPKSLLLPAPAADVAAFLLADLDDQLIEDLWFAFTLVKKDLPPGFRAQWYSRDSSGEPLPANYCTLALLFDSTYRPRDQPMKGEPRALPLLRAGRVAEACQLAERRLRVSGAPVVPAHYGDDAAGPRIAAALLIPVNGLERAAALSGVLTN